MPMPPSTRRVLVAGFDDEGRRALAAALRAGGLEVGETGGSGDLVEAIRSGEPDLVVLVDPSGAPGNCLEIVEEIRRRAPPCLVVLVTGRTDLSSLEEGILRGADDYVTRPFDPEDLRRRIESLLGDPPPRDEVGLEALLFAQGVGERSMAEARRLRQEIARFGFRVGLDWVLLASNVLSPAACAVLRRRGTPPAIPLGGIVRLSRIDREVLERSIVSEGILEARTVRRLQRLSAHLAGRGIDRPWTALALELGIVDQARIRALLRATKPATASFAPAPPSGGFEEVGFLEAVEVAFGPTLLDRIRACGLGRIAVELGLATAREIHDALGAQLALKELGIHRRLGEILVARGVLSEPDLESVLAVRRERMMQLPALEILPTRDRADDLPAATPASGARDPGAEALEDEGGLPVADEGTTDRLSGRIREHLFGRIAVREGRKTHERIRDALRRQICLSQAGIVRRIGEILVERGALGAIDVLSILERQRSELERIPWASLVDAEPIRPIERELARILVEQGLLDANQVGECSYVQQRAAADLGIEIPLAVVLAEKGYLDREVSEILLEGLARPREVAGEPKVGTIQLARARERILAAQRRRRGLRARPVLAARRSSRRWLAAGLAGTLAIGTSFLPPPAPPAPGPVETRRPIEAGPVDPPGPSLDAAGPVRLVGVLRTLERLPDGRVRLVLDVRGRFRVAEGTRAASAEEVERLRSLAGVDWPLEVAGAARSDETRTPVVLPDGNITREVLEFETWRPWSKR